jgi:DNA-binding response OmpR family regulator
VQEVKDALDAGVNEIMIKPATIKGVGDRIRAVLENPREFVRVDAYVGPDRRRRDKPDFKGPERRRRR